MSGVGVVGRCGQGRTQCWVLGRSVPSPPLYHLCHAQVLVTALVACALPLTCFSFDCPTCALLSPFVSFCHLFNAQVLVTVLVACNTAVAVLGAWLLGADANLSMSLISVAALCFGVVLALKVSVDSVNSVGMMTRCLVARCRCQHVHGPHLRRRPLLWSRPGPQGVWDKCVGKCGWGGWAGGRGRLMGVPALCCVWESVT